MVLGVVLGINSESNQEGKRKLNTSSSPITVCQLLHTLNVGGAEILASRLARRMEGERWKFVFFCLDAPGVRAEEMREAGFTVEILGRKPGLDRHCMRELARLWKKHNVRFVQAHQYTPYFYAMGARGLLGRKPPILFTEHGRFYPDLPNWKHAVFNRFLMRKVDRITAVSDSVGRAIVENEGIPADRVEVIRNGVDEARFRDSQLSNAEKNALRASLGLTDERVILFTARLDPIKDHRTAILAMKRLLSLPEIGNSARKPTLLLAGGGPEWEALREFVTENQLQLGKHVRFLGERADVSELLQIADAFLLTSKSEGIPLTILEAFAAGVPVTATNVGGIPEIIDSDENGLLAPSGDFVGISEQLKRILIDTDLSGRLTQNARRRFDVEFTETCMLAKYERIYEEMIQ